MKTSNSARGNAADAHAMSVIGTAMRCGSFVLLCALTLAMAAPGTARAGGPDLTVGTNRYAVDRTYTCCLGPTGMRGWIYQMGFVGQEPALILDHFTQWAPYQILVTSVGTGTPALAAGLLTNDVILGVQPYGGAVAAFTNDTRVELGNAITGAEASNGVLRLLVNRYGVGTNQTYTLQLQMSNMAYSATAPYNCPKSALILSNALKVVRARTIGRLEALALLANGPTAYHCRTYLWSPDLQHCYTEL